MPVDAERVAGVGRGHEQIAQSPALAGVVAVGTFEQPSSLVARHSYGPVTEHVEVGDVRVGIEFVEEGRHGGRGGLVTPFDEYGRADVAVGGVERRAVGVGVDRPVSGVGEAIAVLLVLVGFQRRLGCGVCHRSLSGVLVGARRHQWAFAPRLAARGALRESGGSYASRSAIFAAMGILTASPW